MGTIGIYKITSPSKKIYIGQSINIEKRFKTYLRYSCKSQPKLLASLRKYGSQNHKYEIIHVCSKNELSKNEEYYVRLFSTFESDFGLNIRDGGGNSAKLSEEHKRKISESLKGVKHPPERIENNRKAQLGKKLSEQHKENIRANASRHNLGKKASKETRLKQSLARKGKQPRLGCNLTEEQKRHLSKINLGILNPNYGKKRTEESKQKTRESVKLSWIKRKEKCQKL